MSLFFSILLFFLTVILIFILTWIDKKFKLFNQKRKLQVQDLHNGDIVRLGGVALFFTSLLLLLYLYCHQPYMATGFFAIITLSACVFSIIGIYEDIFPDNSPWNRLFLTLITGLITSILLPTFSIATNIAFLDKLLNNPILLTLFSTVLIATLTHAHNIVDGLNGLSSGSAIFAFLAVICLSLQVNDFELAQIAIILASISLGFFVFNYPIAKIFLGDGGAYWIGSSIVITSLLLISRNSSISLWTILLINFYPFFETIFSIFRKFFIYKASPFRPDAYHLHMITFRIIDHLYSKQKISCVAPSYVNPLSSFALLLLPLLSATLAVISRSSFAGQITSLIGLSGIYTILYWKLKRYEEGLAPSLSIAYKNMI